MSIQSNLEKKITWSNILARYELVKKARALRKPKSRKIRSGQGKHPSGVLLIPTKSILKVKNGSTQRFLPTMQQTPRKVHDFFMSVHKSEQVRFSSFADIYLSDYVRHFDLCATYFSNLLCCENINWQEFSFIWSTRFNAKMNQTFYKDYFLKKKCSKVIKNNTTKPCDDIFLKDTLKRRQKNKVTTNHSHTQIFKQLMKETKTPLLALAWHRKVKNTSAYKTLPSIINIGNTQQEKPIEHKIETKKLNSLLKKQFLEAGGWGNRRSAKLSAHEKKRRRKELQLWKFGSKEQRIVCKQQRQIYINNNIERQNEYDAEKKYKMPQNTEKMQSSAYQTRFFKKTNSQTFYSLPLKSYRNPNQNRSLKKTSK